MEQYKKVMINGVAKKEHRVIWERERGPIPPGYVIHHINGDGFDNRIENLMLLSKGDHLRLHKKLRASGEDPVSEEYKGVTDSRQRCRRYNANNKEVISARNKKYRAEHKAETLAASRAYRECHKEEIAEYQREYYALHKKEKAEYDRIYRERHREEIKKKRAAYFIEYRSATKDKRRADYIANRDDILFKQKQYRDAHREEIRIKDRLWRAIRLNRPQSTIDALREELRKTQSSNHR